MEGSDIHKASTSSIRLGSLRASSGPARSIRAASTSLWRNSGMDVFSKSSREENDEEALKWAALEKLPTFDRLKKGLLFGSTGPSNEVDIDNLGDQDRKRLVDRLVNAADEDNEKFLLRLRNRIDRVGIDLPTIEVKFEHLTVEADVKTGSRALPSFLNFFLDFFEGILNIFHLLPNKRKHITILDDVSGIVKPGKMTLLLGPPSSGKTTLLLALADGLAKELQKSGKVTYNGHELHEFVPKRTSAYISQNDVHIGEMTVRETLAFSARCQGVGSRYDMLAELSRREKNANIKPDPDIDVYMKAAASEGLEASVVTDYTLKILGLDVCADTMVGDRMIRGISGGQKKRVTTGEMIVGPSKVLFMDEISTGLDSSTTFQIVNSVKQYVHILEGTVIISLLQPAPETYNLFDEIILLSDGKIVYEGPRENVLEFFESMGFKCPDRKGVADFLQEVTSKKDQKQYWMRTDEPYRFVTSKEFAKAYESFHVGRKITSEVATPYDKSKSHPAALTNKKYGLGKRELLKACMDREILLMKRNSFVYFFKLFQLTVMGIVAMTVFFRTKMHRRGIEDGGLYVGALFFGVTMIMFNGMAEISMTIAKLPVFYKQRDFLFFPTWVYALPSWFVKIPVSFVEAALWTVLTYHVMGFDPNIWRFLKHFFLLVVVNQMSSALFRFIGASGRNMIVANTFGSFAILILFALGGFVLVREDVKKWWIWGYWTSPMMYAMNGIVVNEYLGHKFKKPFLDSTLGQVIVKSRGLFAESYWYWISIAAMLGFMLFYNLCYAMALQFLDPFSKAQANVEDNDESSSTTNEGNENTKRGMVLPFEPHCITFDDIKYSVDMPQEMKDQGVTEDRLVLLKNLSGAFRPGVLTALMGVSGAGKTTLMDVLAGRKTGGLIEGDVRISGYPKNQETFARISGYCEQNDIHSPHVTVYESLIYSAWLRLPADVNEDTRKMFVNQVMDLVELNPIKDALVGLPGVNGLSTEQRKRLTIAVELVANPSIIFMDEPTSGLDARAAAIVMRTVRNTVDTGRTVVCTIHQPSIDIFEAFDELFLMKRGGREIYVGPVGRESCELIKYFEDIEGVSKITNGYNPATWMLEVSTASQEVALGVDFTDIYKNSELYARNKALIAELSQPRPGSNDLSFPTQYSTSFFVQCWACLWKQRQSYWRNPPYTAVRFTFTTFIALMFGTIFWDLGGKREKVQDLSNAMGSLYTSVLFIGVQNASAVQPVVDIERTVFYRERAAGMYSPLPYAFAQVLVEIPYIFTQAAAYGVIVYAMIGFDWTAAKFFWFLFFMFCSLLYMTFYGMMTVAVSPNADVAAIIAAAFYSLWNLFSGFIIPRPKIPIWWRWYYWANPIAWTLYGLIVSQFGDFEDVLTSGETVKGYLRRLVSDNILHHQELMSGYHRDQGVSRCAFKDGLVDHGVCLLAINHYKRRVFCGKCGLRQDDPVMGSFRVNVVSVKVRALSTRKTRTADKVFLEDVMSSGKPAKQQKSRMTYVDQAQPLWSNLIKSFPDDISLENVWSSLTKPMTKYVNESLGRVFSRQGFPGDMSPG
nr:pleiotropic drug resistance protein 1-like [Tanacetum cinerariifolium]